MLEGVRGKKKKYPEAMNQVLSFYKGRRFRKAELYIEDFQFWKGRKLLSSKNFQTKAHILKAKHKHNCNRKNAIL